MKENIEANLEFPPTTHLGIVVKDIEKTVEYYTSMFDIGPLTIHELSLPKCMLYGKPAPSRFKVSRAKMGSVELELIQVLEGAELHAEFLRTKGEGLHHTGIRFDDFDTYDRLVTALYNRGLKSLLTSKEPGLDIVYFDTRTAGGVIFELYYIEARG